MSTDLYKSEILNISKEVIRIIDRVNELSRHESENLEIEWPPYCEPKKAADNGRSYQL